MARDAEELATVLTRGLNFPLPPDFPESQLLDICASLTQLPEGTAEGARAPLDYARYRLPSIRRQYVLADDGVASGEPTLARGAVFDQKLGILIASVSTALDEYRRLAAEELDTALPVEAGIKPSTSSVEQAVKGTEALEQKLSQAQNTVVEVANPASTRADDLKRQLRDAKGLNTLASAEIRMPRVVVGWLQKTLNALKQSPTIIKRTISVMRVGTDVLEVFHDRWEEFTHDGAKFLFSQFRKTMDSVERAAEIIETAQRSENVDDGQAERPDQIELVVQRRSELQSQVRRTLEELEEIDVYMRTSSWPKKKLEAALSRRAQAERTFFKTMKDLAALDTFVSLHREFSRESTPNIRGSRADPTLVGRGGYGLSQKIFERLTIIAMRRARRPLKSSEVVEELRKLGHPIGGKHEIKTACNRLWEAKTRGVLVHLDSGYWIGLEPYPLEATGLANPRLSKRRRREAHDAGERQRTNPRGREAALSAEEQEQARKMLLSNKTVAQVSRHFHVSTGTIYNYFPGGVEALRLKYPDEVKPRAMRVRRRTTTKRKGTKDKSEKGRK